MIDESEARGREELLEHAFQQALGVQIVVLLLQEDPDLCQCVLELLPPRYEIIGTFFTTRCCAAPVVL